MKKVLKGYGIISMVIAAIEVVASLLASKYDLYEDPDCPFDELIEAGIRSLKKEKAGTKVRFYIVHFIITLIFWPITIPLTFILHKKLNF